MEKKDYLKPVAQTVMVEQQSCLLAFSGSGEVGANRKGYDYDDSEKDWN